MATGGTIAQDLTMQWSAISGFMQDLSLMVIDEGQQYGTDRDIATISLLKQQPLILWTGDAQQTPGGIARTAPNAKRSRRLLLAKRHGIRSNKTYFMPSNLAEAMIKLLEDTANDGLRLVKNILTKGDHILGNVWTSQLPQAAAEDLNAINTVLPGLVAQFRTATSGEVAQLPKLVDPELLQGTTVNFSRSLIRLAWMLQHAETLLPMAGEIQAELNSHTAGVSGSHAWGLMLPSSSRVSPVTYHSVVAVRYPDPVDSSTDHGNSAASRQGAYRTDPLVTNSCFGTQMPRSMDLWLLTWIHWSRVCSPAFLPMQAFRRAFS